MYTRRQFLQSAILSSGATLLASCSAARGSSLFAPPESTWDDLPVDRAYRTQLAPRRYFGPDPSNIHPHLWSRTQQASPSSGTIPLPQPRYVIDHQGPLIIGGGLSGLGAAHYVRHKNPLVLEASSHFGGNSQGQEWDGVPYSIGAAYFVQPEDGSDIHTLLEDLNLISEIKNPTGADEYAEGAHLKHGLWKGGAEVYGRNNSGVVRLHDYLSALQKDEEPSRYPDIPTNDPQLRSYINELDAVSFADHLEKIMGGPAIHPLSTALEQYCWSAFGANSSEISAASGLNFLTAELESIAVLPGGNSRVTERLVETLRSELGKDALRSKNLVLNVKAIEAGVEVLALDHNGEVYGIRSPVAIVACPKFVAKRIVEGCLPEQYACMHRLKYRAYITANVVVKGAPSFSFYDLYLLHQRPGHSRLDPTTSVNDIAATDAILANWAVGHPSHSVLSLYRALPFDGGRTSVFAEGSYEATRQAFEKQIEGDLLPLFGLASDAVVDLRITRWGHALPVAARGFIAQGGPELVARSVADRIFFAQQDNWALPAFEVALYEAKKAANAVLKILG